MRMRTKFVLALFSGVGLTTGAAHAQVGYTLDVTTHYQFGSPGPTLNNVTGGPDTGFFQIMNNGTTTFMGSIGDVAVSNFGGDVSFTSAPLTLAPGASAWVGIGPAGGSFDSSNVGGYNGPFGSSQPGVLINLMGTVTDGVNTEGVSLSVHDSDIHSGVIRSANGHPSDSYVLQGGDPTGGDTGDGFETTQADGHFEFFEAPAPASATPLPASAWGGLALLSGLAASRVLRRRPSVA